MPDRKDSHPVSSTWQASSELTARGVWIGGGGRLIRAKALALTGCGVIKVKNFLNAIISSMKRAVILIIDSLGAGAMPDAARYGDLPECNTLVNVAKMAGGLNLPILETLGLGNIDEIEGVKPVGMPAASFGTMKETAEGKDTTTGHWEIAGLVLEKPFRVYPEGFPQFLIDEFVNRTGCKAVLGNKPASGTAIIEELGDEHVRTGHPIIYTSADSVFQIACHVGVVPLETLYRWCVVARELIDENAREHNICRVIARPFEGKSGEYKRISAARHDYSVPPYKPTVLNLIEAQGKKVLGIGKIKDIFVGSGVTESVHTGSNKEGLEQTIKALVDSHSSPDAGFNSLIFTNLVDTDMLFGHRNDYKGYAHALEEIDGYLGEIIPLIKEEDILIITADHGCDPTVPGTDHTREKVPVLLYGPAVVARGLGVRETFADVAATVAEWLEMPYDGPGKSMLS